MKNTKYKHFPLKCQECAKSSKIFIHAKCSFCQNLYFHEEVFCDLNRAIQNPTRFKCQAFQPLLHLVGASPHKSPPEPKIQAAEIAIGKRLDFPKVKYQRAFALQKLARNPDEVILDIKYHFAWNVINRRSAFKESAPTTIDFISDAIAACSEEMNGFSSLMWLAPDHIHLYVESDGEISPDNMAQQLKQLTETSILKRFPYLILSSEEETGLWDKTYFVETIG